MGNSKNGKKGKNIKKAKECDNNHDFWVSREPECFICLQCCEGSLFSIPHWGLKSPHFAPLFSKVDFSKVDLLKVESGKERTPPRLKEQQIYVTVCKCDGWVHNRCLETWVNINKKCPICCILVNKKPFLSKYLFYTIIKLVGCAVIICALYVIGCALYVVMKSN